jgi:hypothetical protein
MPRSGPNGRRPSLPPHCRREDLRPDPRHALRGGRCSFDPTFDGGFLLADEVINSIDGGVDLALWASE